MEALLHVLPDPSKVKLQERNNYTDKLKSKDSFEARLILGDFIDFI